VIHAGRESIEPRALEPQGLTTWAQDGNENESDIVKETVDTNNRVSLVLRK
jgi:hypothetical protein